MKKTRLLPRLLLFLLFGFTSLTVQAQMTLIIDQVPRHFSPFLDTIFIAGDFNNWNPGDPQFALTDNGNGQWSVILTGTNGSTVQYKFTRGDWPRVETLADGSFRPNRSLTFQNGASLTHTIENWEDTAGQHTVVGNTYWLDYNFYMPQLGRSRRIWLYLPPDYFNSGSDYPVLYMHDGQNLFDYLTSFSGEWGIDESMEQLIQDGEQPAIVVGIDNGGGARIDEYSPWVNQTYGGGQGTAYVNFIVNTLKPWIDNNYRTLPGREHTAIMGSSLGGLISHYAAVSRQDIFSKAGLLSPSYWFSEESYTVVSQFGRQYPMRYYLLAGGQESATMVPNMLRMADSLAVQGFDTSEVKAVEKWDGQHSEWFWEREFPDAFRWLFRTEIARQAGAGHLAGLSVFPSPASQYLNLAGPVLEGAVYHILDLTGRIVSQGKVADQQISLEGLNEGVYFLQLENQGRFAVVKFMKQGR